jgi:hypothetical protein
MRCQNCRTPLPAGATICTRCGKTLQQPKVVQQQPISVSKSGTMRCLNCGTELPEATIICTSCGGCATTAGGRATAICQRENEPGRTPRHSRTGNCQVLQLWLSCCKPDRHNGPDGEAPCVLLSMVPPVATVLRNRVDHLHSVLPFKERWHHLPIR